MKDFDVIVIGAGFGGATTAALLAQGGKRVLLVEQNPNAGGKGMTLQQDGHRYAAWVVVSAPVIDSTHEQLIRRLGLEKRVTLVPATSTDSIYQTRSGEFRKLARAPGNDFDPAVLLDWLEVPEQERMHVMGVMMEIATMSPESIDALDDLSFAEWLGPRQLPRPVQSFLVSLMCDLMYMVPVDVLCASEAVLGLQSIFLRGGGLFCIGGFGALAEALCGVVREQGGEVSMGTRVQRIHVQGGAVVGVGTDRGDFRALRVVSNAGIQPTVLKLLADAPVPPALAARARGLKPSAGMMGTRYFLREPLLDVPYGVIFSEDSPWSRARFAAACAGSGDKRGVVFFEAPSVYDPAAAPPGKQVLLTGYWCPADPNLQDDQLEQWRDAHESVMRAAYPRLGELIERSELYTTRDVSRLTREAVLPGQGGECIGLGQQVGQCGASKPDIRSGIAGLYFSGCDAGGRGVGTQQAVASGMAVAEAILAEA